MPMSSSATSGRRAAKLRSAALAVVREFDFVSFEAQEDREAFGRIAIVVGEQDAFVGRAIRARTARAAGIAITVAAATVRAAER